MRILILSDSHYSNLDNIDFQSYDTVFHAGDYGNSEDLLKEENVLYVRGNCDYEGPIERTLTLNGRTVYITHGNLFGVKEGLTRLLFKGLSQNADYVIYGHTHIPDLEVENHIVFINPGAYQDGYYVIAEDNRIVFYRNGKMIKEYKRGW